MTYDDDIIQIRETHECEMKIVRVDAEMKVEEMRQNMERD